MKLFISIISFFIFLHSTISAQSIDIVKIENDSIGMSRGIQVAYIVHIPNVTLKDTEQNWKKLFSRKTSSPINIQNNEIQIKKVVLKNITDKPINIYSILVKPQTNEVKLISFFEIDSTFFTPFKTQTIEDEKIHFGIQNLLTDFVSNQYYSSLKKELFQSKSELRVAQNKLSKQERLYERFMKDEVGYSQKLDNNNTEIYALTNDLKRTIEQIELKKDAIASIRDNENLYKIGKKQLKSLNKEKKKTQNAIEKLRKDNISSEIKVEKLQKESISIKEEMDNLEIIVEEKQSIVRELERELEKLKN